LASLEGTKAMLRREHSTVLARNGYGFRGRGPRRRFADRNKRFSFTIV
jgi:hypothetical protein